MSTHLHIIGLDGETVAESDVEFDSIANMIVVRGSSGQSVFRVPDGEEFVKILIGSPDIHIEPVVPDAKTDKDKVVDKGNDKVAEHKK